MLGVEVEESVEGGTDNKRHARTLGEEPFDKTAATKCDKTISDHAHDNF